MTTQELRELDCFVAKEVMGWRYDNFYWWHGTDILELSECPRFTTDSKYAMDVLKKCAEKEEITIAIEKKESDRWIVGFIQWGDEAIWNQKSGETLELAICLFAKQLFSQTTK